MRYGGLDDDGDTHAHAYSYIQTYVYTIYRNLKILRLCNS